MRFLLLFSEIESFHCSLSYHHPTVLNLGDITQITEQQIAGLSFDSPCFPKGTMIATDTGYKSIDQVKVGDKVLTHTNTYKSVLKTGGKNSQPLYRVRVSGMSPILCTAEHPFYVRKMTTVWDSEYKDDVRIFYDPTWVEAKDLSYDDFLSVPVIKQESNVLNLSDDECYILGRYLADRYTNKHSQEGEDRLKDNHWQPILSVGNKLADTQSWVKRKVKVYRHSEISYRDITSSKRLTQIVEQHLGYRDTDKFISPTILNLPKDKLQIFLNGYMDRSGGYIKNRDVWFISTLSRTLADCLVLLIAKLYNTLATINKYDPRRTAVIKGGTDDQKKPMYTIWFRTTSSERSKYYFDGNLLWVRLKDLELTSKISDVFNLEVEDDNTYTANNIIVHNCQVLQSGIKQL